MAKSKSKAESQPAESGVVPTPRLQEQYHKEIVPKLIEKLGRKNLLSLPKLQKISVNMGVGSATQDKKHMEDAVKMLTIICGQKPAITAATKSIAGFRLREGMQVGAKVTLRGARMYEFLDRLIAIAIPRVRDFRGLNPKAFDGNGNYSLGLSESLVFPELDPDKFTRQQGMNITMCISGGDNTESRELLQMFGMPFKT